MIARASRAVALCVAAACAESGSSSTSGSAGGSSGGPAVTVELRLPPDAPDLVAEDFVLEVLTGNARAKARGRALTRVPAAGAPLSVAILVQGNVRFMGNSATLDENGEPIDPIPGAHGAARLAIEAIAKGLPPKAEVAVLTYGEEVVTRAPFAPAATVTGDALGGEETYRASTTKRLVDGLGAAIDLLAPRPGRRVIVVIGDAGDVLVNADLKDVVARARQARVEAWLLHASPRPDELELEANLKRARALGALGGVVKAPSIDAIPDLAASIARAIDGAWTVEFPAAGFDLSPDRDHEASIRLGLSRSATFRFRSPDELARRIFVLSR